MLSFSLPLLFPCFPWLRAMPIFLRRRNLGNGKRKIFVFGAIGVAGKGKIIKFM
jgi:hypothetical protein